MAEGHITLTTRLFFEVISQNEAVRKAIKEAFLLPDSFAVTGIDGFFIGLWDIVQMHVESRKIEVQGSEVIPTYTYDNGTVYLDALDIKNKS